MRPEGRRSSAGGRGRATEGGATVAACLAVTALLLLTVLIVQLAAVVCARHRAQSAADLAALAAAAALGSGTGTACDQAQSVAQRMGMHVRTCSVRDWDVTVSVDAAVTLTILGERSVVAIARAGPVEAEKRS